MELVYSSKDTIDIGRYSLPSVIVTSAHSVVLVPSGFIAVIDPGWLIVLPWAVNFKILPLRWSRIVAVE